MKNISKVKKACGLYLRVSTDMQANVRDGSLDTQLSSLTKYTEIKTCNSDEDWYVAEVYREEGKSGKNTDRPEYQRMLGDLKAGKLNVLLCTKIDRVHRSLVDFYKLHEIIDAHDVTFVSLSENWDTSTPMGRFGLKLTLAVAELEREQTSQRTREKMRWRAEEGLWNGGQILGYDIDPEERGVIKVNENEAKIVRLIYETYLDVGSFRMTAKTLNEMGYRTKAYESRRGHTHGNQKFKKVGITGTLKNPVYLGKVTHKGDVFPGKHEPIINESLWQAVQDRIGANRVVRKIPRERKKHKYLLDGLLRCGWCGGHMTPTYSGGRSGVTYFYYQCTSSNRGADECNIKRVNAGAIEDVIAERLISMGSDEKLLKEIIAEANSMMNKDSIGIEERLKYQKQTLSPIKQEITNIVKFIAKGKGTDALSKELEKLEVQKSEIEGEIEKIEMEKRELKNSMINAEVVSEGLRFFEEAWKIATEKEKRDLFRLFIHRIIWNENKDAAGGAEIKMGLYARPKEIFLIPTDVNRKGDFAVSSNEWLPSADSNHGPSG